MGRLPSFGLSFLLEFTCSCSCERKISPSRKEIPLRREGSNVCAFFSHCFLPSPQLEVHSELVEVPETSADAKKWPVWKGPTTTTECTETSDVLHSVTAVSATNPTTTQISNADRKSAESSISTTSADTNFVSSTVDKSIATATPTPTSALRKPGPRKSKVTLAPLPGPSKAKKLTTLDKSAMDWKNHIRAEQEAGSSVVDELEANRRGGGYLEKVEFLKRVEERREDNLDTMKSTKRRKLWVRLVHQAPICFLWLTWSRYASSSSFYNSYASGLWQHSSGGQLSKVPKLQAGKKLTRRLFRARIAVRLTVRTNSYFV